MITVEHPARMHRGIYFSLDDSSYHDALALSAHGIMNMRISLVRGDASPYDFWARCRALNPHYDEDVASEDDTEAKLLGDAYECRIILGAEHFYRHYAAELDPRDYPSVPRTNEEIAARIIAAGGPIKGFNGKRKHELVDLLRIYDPEAVVWDSLLRSHAAKHEGKILLKPQYLRRIERAAAMIEHNPQLKYAFRGGMPKVAVFWEDRETGVPMKCQMDYFKERVPGTFSIVENKSFANNAGLPLDMATDRAKTNYRYPLQLVTYLEGAAMARQFSGEGLVFGDVEPAYIRALATCETFDYTWIWQQKGPAPVAFAELWTGTATNEQIELDLGKKLFSVCWQQHGADTPWVQRYKWTVPPGRSSSGSWQPAPALRIVSDSDLPPSYR